MAVDEFMPIPGTFWDFYPDANRFLVSYPRSGSRWIQLIYTDLCITGEGGDPARVYQQKLGRETEVSGNNAKSRNLCPCVYRVHLKQEVCEKSARVFRAHSYEEILRRDGARIFYVFRRPDRMLESYENFARDKELWVGDDSEEVRASFADARLREWIRSVEGIIEFARNSPERVRIRPYEEASVFSVSVIEAFLQHVGVEFRRDDVEAAVARFHSFLRDLNGSGKFVYARGGDIEGVADTSAWWSIDEATRDRAESLHREALLLATC